jgi:hypothetical protein
MGLKALAAMLFVSVLITEGAGWARSVDMKKPCVDCHTMHNSQNGLTPEVSSPSRRAGGSGALQPALLNTSCYGCHSDAISHVDTPVVLHFTLPTYGLTGTEAGHNTLAGGDFHWVSVAADLKGHNVDGFSTQSSRRPPGWSGDPFVILTCAGTTGCHGYLNRTGEISAMYQTHHAVEPQPDPRVRDGNTLASSFRWLNGVAGYEDPDYELTVSSGVHNQYIGMDRIADSDSSPKTISHLCANCHGDFHFGPLASGVTGDPATFAGDPWIRHPVDYDMGGLGGEFLGYGAPAVGAYNVATPLGSKYTGSPLELAPKATVTLASSADDAIIVCVSCHRAHGSPYDYSLRWNYKDWPGGVDAYNGCGDCHTAKD